MRSFVIGLVFIGCGVSFGDADQSSEPGSLFSDDGEYIPGSLSAYWVDLIHKLAVHLEGGPAEWFDEFAELMGAGDGALKEGNLDKVRDLTQQVQHHWKKILPFAESDDLRQTISNTIDTLGGVEQKFSARTATIKDIDTVSKQIGSSLQKMAVTVLDDDVAAEIF